MCCQHLLTVLLLSSHPSSQKVSGRTQKEQLLPLCFHDYWRLANECRARVHPPLHHANGEKRGDGGVSWVEWKQMLKELSLKIIDSVNFRPSPGLRLPRFQILPGSWKEKARRAVSFYGASIMNEMLLLFGPLNKY